MSKDNTNRAEVESFIRAYFAHELEQTEPEIVERKGYTAVDWECETARWVFIVRP